MNKETFPKLLRHPANLSRLNFEELRSLSEDYPYAQNLRYLLAKKARMEDRPEFDRLLGLAAMYSIDREYLSQLIEGTVTRESVEEPLQLEGERLRTDELSLEQLPQEGEESLILQEPEAELLPLEEEVFPAASADEPDSAPGPRFTLQDLMHLSDEEPLPSVSDLALPATDAETPVRSQDSLWSEESLPELESPPTGESKLSEVEEFLAQRARRRQEDPTPGAAFAGAAGIAGLAGDGLAGEVELPSDRSEPEQVTEETAPAEPEAVSPVDQLLEDATNTEEVAFAGAAGMGALISAGLAEEVELPADPVAPEAPTELETSTEPEAEAEVPESVMPGSATDDSIPPVISSGLVVPPVESFPLESEVVEESDPTIAEEVEVSSEEATEELWQEIEHDAETLPKVPEPVLREREELLHKKTTLTLSHLLAGQQDPEFVKQQKKRAKRAKREKARSTAKRSLQESDALVSETLAQLLERQGHTDRAIEMYEQLSLIYPEKSSFFARKIETLRDQ